MNTDLYEILRATLYVSVIVLLLAGSVAVAWLLFTWSSIKAELRAAETDDSASETSSGVPPSPRSPEALLACARYHESFAEEVQTSIEAGGRSAQIRMWSEQQAALHRQWAKTCRDAATFPENVPPTKQAA